MSDREWSPERLAVLAEFGIDPDISPVELATRLLAGRLALEVRKKLKADQADGCDFPDEVIEGVNEHNVVEMVEAMVEGDEVLDDAATHRWFRNILDTYRTACAKLNSEPWPDEGV